jgi:hypothetical protein
MSVPLKKDMLQNSTPFVLDSPNTHYCLAKNAPAMQIVPDETGKLRLGTLTRLPEDAQVELCGEGFDDRTAKVIWGGSTYYVFREDLQSDLRARSAAVGR